MAKEKQARSGLIGIDIGRDSVAIAQVIGNEAHLLVERLPEELINDEGEIVAAEAMAVFLSGLKEKGYFSDGQAALILPPKSTYFRTIKMPAVTESQLLLNLPYEFRDYVGAEGGNYQYDYAVRDVEYDQNGEPSSYTFYAAAAEKAVMEKMANVLSRAGMPLQICIPREMALVNLLHDGFIEEEAGQEYCIVEVGYESTNVYITCGDALVASRVIEAGCKDLDKAIAALKKVDEHVAATYRQANYQGVLRDEACLEVLNKIALEVTKAINFYQYENPDGEIRYIRFCGTGLSDAAIEDAIVDYVGLAALPMEDLLPEACDGRAYAASCAMAIGATR